MSVTQRTVCAICGTPYEGCARCGNATLVRIDRRDDRVFVVTIAVMVVWGGFFLLVWLLKP